jgi:hypothetical protein
VKIRLHIIYSLAIEFVKETAYKDWHFIKYFKAFFCFLKMAQHTEYDYIKFLQTGKEKILLLSSKLWYILVIWYLGVNISVQHVTYKC